MRPLWCGDRGEHGAASAGQCRCRDLLRLRRRKSVSAQPVAIGADPGLPPAHCISIELVPTMLRTHPHAAATYRVITLDDGSFGVEVTIPDSHPTTVKSFPTEADAEAWIAGHRQQVQ